MGNQSLFSPDGGAPSGLRHLYWQLCVARLKTVLLRLYLLRTYYVLRSYASALRLLFDKWRVKFCQWHVDGKVNPLSSNKTRWRNGASRVEHLFRQRSRSETGSARGFFSHGNGLRNSSRQPQTPVTARCCDNRSLLWMGNSRL